MRIILQMKVFVSEKKGCHARWHHAMWYFEQRGNEQGDVVLMQRFGCLCITNKGMKRTDMPPAAAILACLEGSSASFPSARQASPITNGLS